MPAIASLEDLKKLNAEIEKVKQKYPDAAAKIVQIIKQFRKVGYRNFCKLFTEERTPEQLKEGAR